MLSKWIQLLSPFALGVDFAFILQYLSMLNVGYNKYSKAEAEAEATAENGETKATVKM